MQGAEVREAPRGRVVDLTRPEWDLRSVGSPPDHEDASVAEEDGSVPHPGFVHGSSRREGLGPRIVDLRRGGRRHDACAAAVAARHYPSCAQITAGEEYSTVG